MRANYRLPTERALVLRLGPFDATQTANSVHDAIDMMQQNSASGIPRNRTKPALSLVTIDTANAYCDVSNIAHAY